MSSFIQFICLFILILEIFWRLKWLLIVNLILFYVFLARDVAQRFSWDWAHASVRSQVASHPSGFRSFQVLRNIWWIGVLADGSWLVLIIWIFEIIQIDSGLNDVWLFVLNTIKCLQRSWLGQWSVLFGTPIIWSLLVNVQFRIVYILRGLFVHKFL